MAFLKSMPSQKDCAKRDQKGGSEVRVLMSVHK
jgi:hypothetical protein